MSVLAVGIHDGVLDYTPTDTYQKEDTKGTDALGKDAFLTLLCTQMQYQDPLDPSSDTDYIAQLAQFSALEEMQNVSASLENQTAQSLVGQNVIMAVGSSTGETVAYVAGVVQYTEMDNGKPYLCIDGSLYDYNDLYSVVDSSYLDKVKDELEKDA